MLSKEKILEDGDYAKLECWLSEAQNIMEERALFEQGRFIQWQELATILSLCLDVAMLWAERLDPDAHRHDHDYTKATYMDKYMDKYVDKGVD